MRISKLSLALTAAIALTGCGGGGSSSHDSGNNADPADPAETSNVIQEFRFNAFSSQDAADIVTGGNFNNSSETFVCLDLNNDSSCRDEQYAVSGTGLNFSDKLEWPGDLNTDDINIIAVNDNFTYSIPAGAGLSAALQESSTAPDSAQKRNIIYINPVSGILHANNISYEDLLQGCAGDKYSAGDFSAQKPFDKLDQEILTLGDTLVSVNRDAVRNNLSDDEIKNRVSGALQAIINAFKDSAASVAQVLLNVAQYSDYSHLNKEDPESRGANNAPAAEFAFETGNYGAVSFVNSSFDPDGDDLIYKWKFGDGSESAEKSPDHRYRSNGLYHAFLVVTDSSGASSYIVQEISVNDIDYNNPEQWYTMGDISDKERSCFIPHNAEKFKFLAMCNKLAVKSDVSPADSSGSNYEIRSCGGDVTVNGEPMTYPDLPAGCQHKFLHAEIGSVAEDYLPPEVRFEFPVTITQKMGDGEPDRTESASESILYKDSTFHKHYDGILHNCLIAFSEDSETGAVTPNWAPLFDCGVDGIIGKELVYAAHSTRLAFKYYDEARRLNRYALSEIKLYPDFYPPESKRYGYNGFGKDLLYFKDHLKVTLVIADGITFKGSEARGRFYFGDDPSKAKEFRNGQIIDIGEFIEVPDDKEYIDTKLTLIYNTATIDYIVRKMRK